MFPHHTSQNPIPKVFLTILVASSLFTALEKSASAQHDSPSFKVLVNSDRDTINPDQELTLREAISLVNRTLTLQELSASEQQQITAIPDKDASRIEFDFTVSVKIELESALPPLINTGLVIDGTSHPNYDPNKIVTIEKAIPVPVVSITAAPGKNVFRGLTIAGDRITVKGLSIYGFSQPNFPTDTTPGGDIVVSSRLPNLENKTEGDLTPKPPLNVKIIDNWLGLPPDNSLPESLSSFGVWLFDGQNTVIQHNRIYNHAGSAILTSVDAQGMQILDNIIVGNGLTGMPHAIYLEGLLEKGAITNNLLCGNDGSAVYLFKSEGSIKINSNQIKFNGRRVPSAAVYLMGEDHQVTANQISWQTGPGVTIAAYPQSDRNFLENNQFTNLEGLSIDLNTRDHTSKPFFNLGDGVNPPRDSGNRKRDTANRGIDAPQFLSEDFYIINGKVNIDGLAEPGAKVTLYLVESSIARPIAEQSPLASQSRNYGPLSSPLNYFQEPAIADSQGKFSFTLTHPQPGAIISAIASHPDYGTSEPALNAVIKSFDQSSQWRNPRNQIPHCTTKPVFSPPQPPIKPPVAPPPPIILKVLRNIHFALDQSDISAASGLILDQVATLLKQYPFLTIELQGHTDYRASDQYNLALSKRRAIATRDYLLRQGVQPERMIIRPLGESKLKKSGNTIVEHAYNRRVEIMFYDLQGLEIILEEQDRDLQIEN
jgi:outer membrane protein OmpA-like peptidoglycan-associated protein